MDILPVQGKFQKIILKRYKYLALVSDQIFVYRVYFFPNWSKTIFIR